MHNNKRFVVIFDGEINIMSDTPDASTQQMMVAMKKNNHVPVARNTRFVSKGRSPDVEAIQSLHRKVLPDFYRGGKIELTNPHDTETSKSTCNLL